MYMQTKVLADVIDLQKSYISVIGQCYKVY